MKKDSKLWERDLKIIRGIDRRIELKPMRAAKKYEANKISKMLRLACGISFLFMGKCFAGNAKNITPLIFNDGTSQTTAFTVPVSSLAAVVAAGNCTNCISTINAQGQITAYSSGSAGGGSGTVNSGTIGQNAYYATGGTAISGSSNMITNTSSETFNVTTNHLFGAKTSSLTITGLSAGVLQTAAVSSNVVVAAVNLGSQVTGNLQSPAINGGEAMRVNIDPSNGSAGAVNGPLLFYLATVSPNDSNFPDNDIQFSRQIVGGIPTYQMALGMRTKPGEDPYFSIAPINSDTFSTKQADVFHIDVSSISSSKGFVGINKSTPIVNLDVNGTIAASTITAQVGLTGVTVSTTLFVVSGSTQPSQITTGLTVTGGPAILQGDSLGVVASTGNYGEKISSSALNATNLPATTNWGDLVSVALTTGSWSVTLQECEQANGATLTSGGFIAISTTSGNSAGGLVYPDNEIQLPLSATTDGCNSIPAYPLIITANKTVYGKMQDAYVAGQPKMIGVIRAIRAY